MTIYPSFQFGAGTRRGIVDGVTGRTCEGTLAELEAQLRAARALGAPDDASVARTSLASIYAVEILWAGEPR